MERTKRPAISVVMIVGTNRENAQGVLDALSLQARAHELLRRASLRSQNLQP